MSGPEAYMTDDDKRFTKFTKILAPPPKQEIVIVYLGFLILFYRE